MELILNLIVDIFAQRGFEKYADEEVTQLQHALQCAAFARQENASASLVSAALLHDIGHIVGQNDLPESRDQNLNDDHEALGYEFLYVHFGEEVAEPVRLHVAAKRYLCTTNPSYAKQLSPTSLKSYLDQGGEMSSEELEEFEAHPFFESALRLRKWDDAAKDPSNTGLEIEQFLPDCRLVLEERRRLVGN